MHSFVILTILTTLMGFSKEASKLRKAVYNAIVSIVLVKGVVGLRLC